MLMPLIKKDLEQHRKGLLIYAASVILVPFVFAAFNRSTNAIGFVGSIIGYLGFGGPMLMALWFIGQEKTKGTFRILRTLPISGAQIIGTKMITSVLVCLALANIVMLCEPPMLTPILHQPLHIGMPWVLALNALICSICCLYSAAFVVLEQKVAIQVSYWGIFALVLAALGLDKISKAQHVNLRSIPLLPATVAGLLIVIALFVVALKFASRVFDRKDWSELEEE